MSSPSKQRAGKERIESLGIPKPRWIQWWQDSDKTDWATRIGIVVAGMIAMLVMCETWRPPFAFHDGMIPTRELITRVRLEVPDKTKTDAIRDQKRRETFMLYRNRPQPLEQLQDAVKNKLLSTLAAASFDQLDTEGRSAFAEFYAGDEADEKADTPAARFSKLKEIEALDPQLVKVKEAIQIAMRDMIKYGVLQSPAHSGEEGNQQVIRVYTAGQIDEAVPVELNRRVVIAEVAPEFQQGLNEQFRVKFDSEGAQDIAAMIGKWIIDRLPDYQTLQWDEAASQKAREKAAAAVDPVMTVYFTGKSVLAGAGKPLSPTEMDLLHREWEVLVSKMQWTDKLMRVFAYAGMIIALCMLCGSYIFFVDDRSLLLDHWKLAKLIALMVFVVVAGYHASQGQWRIELIPLILGSVVAAVVYGRELGLLLMAAASVSVALFAGADLPVLVVMAAACTSCTLLIGRIRSRTHLLYVGASVAVITMFTLVGVGIVTGQTLSGGDLGSGLEPLYLGPQFDMVISGLLKDAAWAGCCILVSAAAITPFLPWVEKGYGVQTDLSLLELGDASHPLLRRLAQRAPGTYNHSINVASISEAAADAIGANGLLVRVGAYFHDIGKMFKPEYFIENQSGGVNQHDSLQPAMSTLVIIAHVKDGADLARSHHLPKPIIDFILQHHGTTLVEYFYREAAKRSEEDPNRESVKDQDFRYPGPRPQTLEAAVLMLADTVESASRTLVDPTPSRIQGLVDSIAQKKVADGQFDECGMTFRQLHRVKQSLVKSLTAIYHARVKYPGQQSA